MKSWYVQSQPTFNSGLENEEFNIYSSDGLDEILEETPLGKDITLCKGLYNGETDTFETEITTKGIIQGTSPETQTKGWQRQLLTRLNTISDYKYVRAENKLWLIVTMPTNNQLYEKVVLYLCNYIAKWQDSDGNIIYQPFVTTNASQYNSGEEGNKTLTIGYNQFLIYTSLDEKSMALSREKRLFIDNNRINPLPYKITRIDTVSNSFGENRVLTLVVTENQYNPATDNIDLMICDYISPTPTPPTPTNIEITYAGQPQIRCGGSAKTFTANTENEITIWSLNCTSAQNGYVVLTDNGNGSCKVKCLNNNLLIGSSFRLVCTVGEVESSILINIVGGM